MGGCLRSSLFTVLSRMIERCEGDEDGSGSSSSSSSSSGSVDSIVVVEEAFCHTFGLLEQVSSLFRQIRLVHKLLLACSMALFDMFYVSFGSCGCATVLPICSSTGFWLPSEVAPSRHPSFQPPSSLPSFRLSRSPAFTRIHCIYDIGCVYSRKRDSAYSLSKTSSSFTMLMFAYLLYYFLLYSLTVLYLSTLVLKCKFVTDCIALFLQDEWLQPTGSMNALRDFDINRVQLTPGT